jgi:hypothetical protein
MPAVLPETRARRFESCRSMAAFLRYSVYRWKIYSATNGKNLFPGCGSEFAFRMIP